MPLSPESSFKFLNTTKIIDWYNDTVKYIINSEDLPEYMKTFYEESWLYDNGYAFCLDNLSNLSWYMKSDKDKEDYLDNELENYFS